MQDSVCIFGDLGLAIGAMMAVLTDDRGQPVMWIERHGKQEYDLITVKPGGVIYNMPSQHKDGIPDASYIGCVVRELGLPSKEAEAGMLRLLNRCGGKKQNQTIMLHGLPFAQPKRAWLAGDGIVVVDSLLFDAAWSRDDDYYVGYAGQGGRSTQTSRYRGFMQWLRNTDGKKPIEMAEVSLGVGLKNGVPQFTDGRYRFAVLRDLGYRVIPVSTDVDSQSEIDRLYGVRS